jgi:hypothetical protein
MEFARNFLNKFWSLHKAVVLKNLQYKNLHKGQTCLIFGNGGSLKYYNLDIIRDFTSIGCTYALADKRMVSAGLTYCIIPDSYLFYYFRRGVSSRKPAVNWIGPILKKIILKNVNTKFFCSLTNYYGFKKKPMNLNYFHHFEDKISGSYDLASNFSYCSGALDMMIGLAKYLGFSKVVLLGCDYLATPKLEGHFYSDSMPFFGKDDPQYLERIKNLTDNLDVLVILPKGSVCSVFRSSTFEEYFGIAEVYQSNVDILDGDYLTMMRKAALSNQIHL